MDRRHPYEVDEKKKVIFKTSDERKMNCQIHTSNGCLHTIKEIQNLWQFGGTLILLNTSHIPHVLQSEWFIELQHFSILILSPLSSKLGISNLHSMGIYQKLFKSDLLTSVSFPIFGKLKISLKEDREITREITRDHVSFTT